MSILFSIYSQASEISINEDYIPSTRLKKLVDADPYNYLAYQILRHAEVKNKALYRAATSLWEEFTKEFNQPNGKNNLPHAQKRKKLEHLMRTYWHALPSVHHQLGQELGIRELLACEQEARKDKYAAVCKILIRGDNNKVGVFTGCLATFGDDQDPFILTTAHFPQDALSFCAIFDDGIERDSSLSNPERVYGNRCSIYTCGYRSGTIA